MRDDVKLILWAGVGIAFLAWGVVYASQIGTLTTGLTGGYANVVHALEPPQVAGAYGSSAGVGQPGGYGSLNPN